MTVSNIEKNYLKFRLKILNLYSYKQYLRSHKWKSFKLQYLKNNKRCNICFSKYKLQVHHLTYIRLGHEKNSDVILLCEKCHKKKHKIVTKTKKVKKLFNKYRKFKK